VVLGYAYAGPFRLRAAYRYTVEDSVYVSPTPWARASARRC
jgi:L-amino acid N-acyltransferase YncA